MNVRLDPVAPADPGFNRLAGAYMTELEPWAGVVRDADGNTPPMLYFARFWSEPGRWAFWIVADGARAGFVLIRERAEGAYEIAEFYVEPRFRRQGVGSAAAHAAFARFPGRWRVRQLAGYAAAEAFWVSAVAGFADTFERVRPGDRRFGSEQRFETTGEE